MKVYVAMIAAVFGVLSHSPASFAADAADDAAIAWAAYNRGWSEQQVQQWFGRDRNVVERDVLREHPAADKQEVSDLFDRGRNANS